MNPLLLASLLVLPQSPSLTAEVSRQRLTIGERLTLTVTVRSSDDAVMEIGDPALTGLAVVERREVSEVVVDESGARARTAVVTYELRAMAAGRAVIGSVEARQRAERVRSSPIAITVTAGRTTRAPLLSPLAQRLIGRAAAPPSPDEVWLTTVVSSDRVLVGEQLDVVIAAWFPRELQARMRRPPGIAPGAMQGVWQYPTTNPSSVVASRRVRGRWMELYAAHVVVFPVRSGELILPPPRMEYAVPTTFSFFSREERYALAGDSTVVRVEPLPPRAREVGGSGVVAHEVSLRVAVKPGRRRVGEPIEISLTLEGEGNVMLWPPPAVRWPEGFRTYPGETSVTSTTSGGRIGGVKLFHILAIPDTAGAFTVPPVAYPFFDPAIGRYQVASTEALSFRVADRADPLPDRAAPPLEFRTRPGAVHRLIGGWGSWQALAVLAVGPLLWTGMTVGRRLRRAPVGQRRPRARSDSASEYLHALAERVPDLNEVATSTLVRALRAGGVSAARAREMAGLRDRLWAQRYAGGSRPAVSDDELRAAAAELRERQPRARRWRRTVVSLALLLPAAARGQAPEALYELGAFQQAADSFAERAGREPAVAAHWYNLGSARYRSGADAQALVAWVIAARLAPRNGRIRRALNTLEAETRRDIDLLWIAPFTVREAWLLGGTLWLGGWVWLAFERRRRAPVLLLGLALAFIVAGLYTERRYGEPVAVAVTDTPLREAPYGSASPVESLEPGAALSVERRQGAWLLAARPDGGRGWLPAAGVVMLPRPR